MATLRKQLLFVLAFLGVTLSAARDRTERSSPTRAQPNGMPASGLQPAEEHRDAQNPGINTPPVFAFTQDASDDIPLAPPMKEAHRFRDDSTVDGVADLDKMMRKSHRLGEGLCQNSVVVVAIISVAAAIFVMYPVVLCVLVCCARKIAKAYREEDERAFASTMAMV